jgi:hypothetical protein
MVNRTLQGFYAAMLWLTEFELAIAQATSTNFKYIGRLKEDVRYWQREQRLFELRSES